VPSLVSSTDEISKLESLTTANRKIQVETRKRRQYVVSLVFLARCVDYPQFACNLLDATWLFTNITRTHAIAGKITEALCKQRVSSAVTANIILRALF
jgi:hypothetical protein